LIVTRLEFLAPENKDAYLTLYARYSSNVEPELFMANASDKGIDLNFPKFIHWTKFHLGCAGLDFDPDVVFKGIPYDLIAEVSLIGNQPNPPAASVMKTLLKLSPLGIDSLITPLIAKLGYSSNMVSYIYVIIDIFKG